MRLNGISTCGFFGKFLRNNYNFFVYLSFIKLVFVEYFKSWNCLNFKKLPSSLSSFSVFTLCVFIDSGVYSVDDDPLTLDKVVLEAAIIVDVIPTFNSKNI